MQSPALPTSIALALACSTAPGFAQNDQDRILWRYEMSSPISGWEVSVGPDGTVYASDDLGLYALNADGSLRWTTNIVRDNTPIAFLADGTLVTRLENSVVALNPDASVRWTFTYASSGLHSQIEVGPSVGPDGNIYGVTSLDGSFGLGAFSLTPQGQLRWSDPGQPPLALINSHTGGPVYFTSERLIFPFAVVTNGAHAVYGFDFTGSQKLFVDFTCLGIPRTDPLDRLLLASGCGIEALEQDGHQSYWTVQFGAVNLAPAIGADATAYAASWFGDVNAIRPDGTIAWTSSSATDAVRMLTVRQDVGRLVYSGATNFGVPDFVSGVDTADGALAWTVDMTTSAGHNEAVWTQRAPTSADGSVVYFATRFTSNGAPGAVYAVRIDDSTCTSPTTYCQVSSNSAGPGALIGHAGTQSIALNQFDLTVSGAIPNQSGLFYYGAAQTEVPFGNGFRCVAAGGVGLFRLPPLTADGTGAASQRLDFTQPPANSGAGRITAGATWYFQFWYRDPAAGGANFNLSNGLAVTFCP